MSENPQDVPGTEEEGAEWPQLPEFDPEEERVAKPAPTGGEGAT